MSHSPTKDWRWPDPLRSQMERAELLVAVKALLVEVESWIHDQCDGTSLVGPALADLQRWRDLVARVEAGHQRQG